MIVKPKQSHPAHAFVAPQSDATSAHWKAHTNKTVLPERRDVKPLPTKPDPHSILHPPVMQTPQAHSGTLIGEDGEGKGHTRSYHQKKGKRK